MARALAAGGVCSTDIIQNSYGYGLFTGGLGAHYGIETLGATVVPTSGGNTERQIMLMRDFGVNGICCTPSYFIHMCEKAHEMGIDMKSLPIRVGFFGAEPWTAEMRQRIEEASGIETFDIYGLSEMSGPGVGIECECHCGLHIFEETFYPEIIDPDTCEVLPDGERGELVFTTINKFGMPMLRYRTRDLTRIIPEPCPCGRTLRRIDRISARSDDMFIIRGVNVFPSQIESALLSVDSAALPHYRITLTRRPDGLDDMMIEIEVREDQFTDEVRGMEALQHKFSHEIERILGIRAFVKMVQPGTIPRSEGKAKRVFDLRNTAK
jgi:phenylacetate-CoA ligase